MFWEWLSKARDCSLSDIEVNVFLLVPSCGAGNLGKTFAFVVLISSCGHSWNVFRFSETTPQSPSPGTISLARASTVRVIRNWMDVLRGMWGEQDCVVLWLESLVSGLSSCAFVSRLQAFTLHWGFSLSVSITIRIPVLPFIQLYGQSSWWQTNWTCCFDWCNVM